MDSNLHNNLPRGPVEKPDQYRLVWDLPLRLFHWFMVIAVSVAGITGFLAPSWWLDTHVVAGYAIGGGHVLHIVSDLTLAADNAVFGQTGPIVGSFDGGFGSSYLARMVGQKRAREIWYLCRQYSADEAYEMGMVNKVVPLDDLEAEGWKWAQEILDMSPLAIRLLKSAFNADLDGQAGIQELAGNATLLYYMTEQGSEGKRAYLEKRKPNFRQYPWLPW